MCRQQPKGEVARRANPEVLVHFFMIILYLVKILIVFREVKALELGFEVFISR